jgi:hypothetical protein
MSGWVIGFGLGLVVVLAVVVLLVLMIAGARSVAARAEAIHAALIDARDNTAGLWLLETTNSTATRLVEHATGARTSIEGSGS